MPAAYENLAVVLALCGDKWRAGRTYGRLGSAGAGHTKALTRFSYRILSRGGADGHGYKVRDRGPRRHTGQYVEKFEKSNAVDTPGSNAVAESR